MSRERVHVSYNSVRKNFTMASLLILFMRRTLINRDLRLAGSYIPSQAVCLPKSAAGGPGRSLGPGLPRGSSEELAHFYALLPYPHGLTEVTPYPISLK